MKTLIFFILFTLSQSWATPSAFDEKFNELQKAMTPTQVKTLLGSPDLREVKGETETWHYTASGGRPVIFTGGVLSEFGREAPLPQETKPDSEPLGHDLEIGGACKEDGQCKSQNCHFHTCSGKNNCSVPLGNICAIDGDCCSGHCDFGKCKKR